MPRIFPVRIYKNGNREGQPRARTQASAGFTLIEVIVTVAVVAMTVAAATSSVLVAEQAEKSAVFYANVLSAASGLQARAYGIAGDDRRGDFGAVEAEREVVTSDAEGQTLLWKIYTLRSPGHERRVSFALHGGPGE
jgi:prepilin-type N-terminal cleavage/methylation domain-containing protein